jgi:hypothetical protein
MSKAKSSKKGGVGRCVRVRCWRSSLFASFWYCCFFAIARVKGTAWRAGHQRGPAAARQREFCHLEVPAVWSRK